MSKKRRNFENITIFSSGYCSRSHSYSFKTVSIRAELRTSRVARKSANFLLVSFVSVAADIIQLLKSSTKKRLIKRCYSAASMLGFSRCCKAIRPTSHRPRVAGQSAKFTAITSLVAGLPQQLYIQRRVRNTRLESQPVGIKAAARPTYYSRHNKFRGRIHPDDIRSKDIQQASQCAPPTALGGHWKRTAQRRMATWPT
ncbi:hypothetical protein MPH_05763 [Macrophomina phaseolina MS6]|uniref:Uncharacterized protein n=1 Tax=Macrophomina phaseolina (strain MS6) TaxID=1126212 RepID=K2RQU2_MACPH|nr:hypothetical protein MPH_05763 [Macrophomina phaseolina MS6]